MADWKTINYPLAHPIKGGAGEPDVTTVTIKEPDVDALERIDDQGFQPNTPPKVRQLRVLVSALTGLSEEAVGKLHRDDFMKIQEAALPFVLLPPESSPEEPKAKTESNSTS